MGDHQTSKYDHEHWPPVALQPRALRFGQDELRVGLLDFGLYELSVEASKLMQGEYLDDLPGLPEGDGESGDARGGSG
jgi:hypothetical protein